MEEKHEVIFNPRNRHDSNPSQDALYDIIIIGSGIAGFSAAMYAARLGMKVLVIGEMPGGKVNLTESIENYPGFVSIRGTRLAELFENHARDYDVDILTDIAEKISRKKGIFLVSTEKKHFKGKTVIIATGTAEKKLNVPGEKEFAGKGVSYCALCDATSAKNKTAAVVGGGDSAVKEANLLARYAKKVYVINNEPKIHGERHNLEKIEKTIKTGKIIVFNSANVVSINGKSAVESITISKAGRSQTLPADWVFIYVGQTPVVVSNDLGIKTNKKGEIEINPGCETNVKGAYAAGDVTSLSWNQAIIAAAQGVTAAYSAYNYLERKK